MIIDKTFCLFYSTVFIAFSIGLFLQSIVNELVNYVFAFIILSVILLILLIWQTNKESKDILIEMKGGRKHGRKTR